VKETDSLVVGLKTYYSPGSEKIAAELQQLVSGAIKYYEEKYSVHFNIKLMVLDSTRWFKAVVPFGFVFYSGDKWLVLNAGMTYSQFKSVYNLSEIAAQLDGSIKANKITAPDLIYSRLKFLSLHELGHYFVDKLTEAKSPNFWTNEFVAWYFANEYISQREPEIKKGFDVFCRTVANNYLPDHKSLQDFNEYYSNLSKGNFAWYHSRFYFLADALYKCSGVAYLKAYEKNFNKQDTMNFTPEGIIERINANCNEITPKWVKATESNIIIP